jgi:DNA-binding CsgD family transcriptional regulator
MQCPGDFVMDESCGRSAWQATAGAIRRQDARWERIVDFLDRVLIDFIDELDAATDLNTQFLALERAALALGYRNVSFTYLPSPPEMAQQQYAPVFRLSRTFSTALIEHCTQQVFTQYAIERIRQCNLQLLQREGQAGDAALAHEHFLDLAGQDDLQQYFLPTFSDGESLAGVAVSCCGADCRLEPAQAQRCNTMQRIARLFSDRVLTMPQYRAQLLVPVLERLSQTERLLLQKLADGRSPKAAITALGLSQRYGEFVMQRLRTKLGNISQQQLLHIARLLELARPS